MSEKVLGVVGKRERDDLLGLELGASQNLYKFRQFSYKSNCSERLSAGLRQGNGEPK